LWLLVLNPPSQDENPSRAEIQWLMHHQSALDSRLQRVEDSLVFRTLRAIGTFYQTHFASDPGSSARVYQAWRARHQPAALEPHFSYEPLISISNLGGDLASLTAQTYKRWELEGSAGEYKAELHPGTVLSPYTLTYAVQKLQERRAGRIYFDHEQPDESGQPAVPVLKPDWSPTLLKSCDYLGDFVLTSREPREGVIHIPEILYSSPRALAIHRLEYPRQHPRSVSILVCTRSAGLLSRCLAGLRGKTDYPSWETVVIHHTGSSDDREIEQIVQQHQAVHVPFTGQFNFSEMNNRGAERASGELLVFLNDDVEPLEPDWLYRLTGWLEDPAIGASGPKLLYPNGAIQHAGIATWIVDGAGHPGRNLRASQNWPWLNATREVTAVTGACLCLRRDDFRAIGGFDPTFPVNYNDVDLCLRLGERGLSVIYDAGAVLQHDESQTRLAGVHYDERRRFFLRWAGRLRDADPFYSPHLAQNNENLTLRG
jgi:GT2 family glycosyltransferase